LVLSSNVGADGDDNLEFSSFLFDVDSGAIEELEAVDVDVVETEVDPEAVEDVADAVEEVAVADGLGL